MNYKIIVLNLKKRIDRKNNIIKLFDNIIVEKYYFYEAIDGLEIPLTLEIKNLFKDNDFANRKGFIGCALSHYNIWIDLVKDKINDYYLIFEDDIDLQNNFNEYLNTCKEYLKDNIGHIDILFLGYHKYVNDVKKYSKNISIDSLCNEKYIGGFFGYIITKNGAIKMLDYIKKNGIKHGIDYLIKINNELNVYEVNPNIVYSDWVKNLDDTVDSNIQRDFKIFDFNDIFDYNNFLFIKDYDQINNDYGYINTKNINELLNISRNNDINIAGFNTLGFIKNKIKDISYIDWFKNDNHGIFINLNKKINVKILCDWCSSEKLCQECNNMSKGNCIWNNIRITHEDENIDYYIIINKPFDKNQKYDMDKTIVFQMEPLCNNEYQNWGVKTWGVWAIPDESKFLHVRTHKKYYNNCMWQLYIDYNQLMNNSIKKTHNYMSTICSSKYYDPGHIKRIDFLKFIENKIDTSIKIDIFGSDNKFQFKNYIKALDFDKKNEGILPYKYYFMVENNCEYNYITEKLWEPIICECLCFYYGAPNVSDYINDKAYVQLDMDDFEKSYNIIKNAIDNDLWSERINIIRKEKYKILNYYNFYPTVERIITQDSFKNKLHMLIKNIKIYILIKDVNINYKIIPFVNSMKEFGFNVDCIKEKLYLDNYENYMIIDDNVDFISSYNNLLNHLLYLPENYDYCLLYQSIENPCIITTQHNSFYYNVKKYRFDSQYARIISKNGMYKLSESHYLVYECYENNGNFNFYTVNGNQLFREET